jgi:hypothetical protein
VNDLRIEAAPVFFGRSLNGLIDFFGHVLERDVHGTILEPFGTCSQGRRAGIQRNSMIGPIQELKKGSQFYE